MKKIGLIKDLAAASVVTTTLLSLITGVLVYSKYVFLEKIKIFGESFYRLRRNPI